MKITDKEFVRLSKTKDEVKERLYNLLLHKSTNEILHPDLKGNVHMLVYKESLYHISILIRYVSVSDFRVVDQIKNELNKIYEICKPVKMTKDNGTLILDIIIKRMK